MLNDRYSNVNKIEISTQSINDRILAIVRRCKCLEELQIVTRLVENQEKCDQLRQVFSNSCMSATVLLKDYVPPDQLGHPYGFPGPENISEFDDVRRQ